MPNDNGLGCARAVTQFINKNNTMTEEKKEIINPLIYMYNNQINHNILLSNYNSLDTP